MQTIRPKKAKKLKHAAITRIPGRPAKPSPKLSGGGGRRASAEIGEIVRKRAEAEAAIAEARKSHERLREAIDILPQGIVFLDADGRYILWNKKYAEIYNRSSDLFEPGVRLQDTIIGVERNDIRKRSAARRWSPTADRSPARRTLRRPRRRASPDRERLTEAAASSVCASTCRVEEREASFRLLFDSNRDRYVCALDVSASSGVSDAAIEHYGYGRANSRSDRPQRQAFGSRLVGDCKRR